MTLVSDMEIPESGSPAAPPARAAPRPLRVLVFTTVFPNPALPLHGLFVFERIRHLADLADVRVVAPVAWYRAFGSQIPSQSVQSAVDTRHPRFWYMPKIGLGARGFCLFLSSLREVWRLRKTFDFDLIDAHFAYPDGFAAILLGRCFGRPVCVTLRGTIIALSQRPLGRRLCDWTLHRAERVIAVAESLAARAREAGIPDDRILTIANSVDTERFRLCDAGDARNRLGLPTEGRWLVSIGHLAPRKGFHRVIRALPRVLETCPDVRLAVVGGPGAEGNNGAELRALARELGVADRVLFAGPQTPDGVAQWLGAADVFVLASDREGCPNVVLEAMACGRPVVATTVGDIGRMVPPFAGILFDDPEDRAALTDGLIEALNRKWRAQQIRDHVAHGSWEGVAERVVGQWLAAVAAFADRRSLGRGESLAGSSEAPAGVIAGRDPAI